MNELTRLIQNDMKPSLGVTEPGAIALAASKARSLTSGKIEKVILEISSGIYKNAFTCGIPNTKETGNYFAAALGAVAGKWEKGLAALDEILDEDIKEAQTLIDEGRVLVNIHEINSKLYIKVTVQTEKDNVQVLIQGAHDQITAIKKNGNVIWEQTEDEKEVLSTSSIIKKYKVSDFWAYVHEATEAELKFIKEAYSLNVELMEAGARAEEAEVCQAFIEENDGKLCSSDFKSSIQAMTAAAIEARVRGLPNAAMSITGSGNHGILCTIPLYAYAKVCDLSEGKLLRATALSYLITMYIKEYSGKLSAFCGCGIAAGTGAAVGLLYLQGGTEKQAELVIQNMASSITGMICTGGNTACVLKASTAIDIGIHSVELAMKNLGIEKKHGINGWTAEQTMQFMGRIASPGMEKTEETIIRILEEKAEYSLKRQISGKESHFDCSEKESML